MQPSSYAQPKRLSFDEPTIHIHPCEGGFFASFLVKIILGFEMFEEKGVFLAASIADLVSLPSS